MGANLTGSPPVDLLIRDRGASHAGGASSPVSTVVDTEEYGVRIRTEESLDMRASNCTKPRASNGVVGQFANSIRMLLSPIAFMIAVRWRIDTGYKLFDRCCHDEFVYSPDV